MWRVWTECCRNNGRVAFVLARLQPARMFAARKTYLLLVNIYVTRKGRAPIEARPLLSASQLILIVDSQYNLKRDLPVRDFAFRAYLVWVLGAGRLVGGGGGVDAGLLLLRSARVICWMFSLALLATV